MPRHVTLILGGARSGKSAYAQQLAEKSRKAVLFVATAEALDDEMVERIHRHQQERPAHWRTLEAPRAVAEQIQKAVSAGELILLDCVTLLASNVIAPLPEPYGSGAAEAALNAEIDALLVLMEATDYEWLIISNEVGLGLVPDSPLGRVYRDALGRANQRLAAAADEVLFLAAGLPIRLKG
jgi:adenosylcobinamide kinase/adenosylcobinamide-phosphate guanylyltransferase